MEDERDITVDEVKDWFDSDLDEETISRVLNDVIKKTNQFFPFKTCGLCGEFLEPGSDRCSECNSVDVRGSFREHQQEVIIKAAIALWVEDYDNVMIEAPTGVGKSPINYTLGQMAESAFYTTPQKQLREQLANDEALKGGLEALRARADYTCGASGKDCASCPINNDDDKSCMEQPDCTYWTAKMRACESQIAAITFSMMIVDNYLPTFTQDGRRVSFDKKRELGICDETHTLESQTASLHAGFKASPWAVPPDVWGNTHKRLARKSDVTDVRDVKEELNRIAERARSYVNQNEGVAGMEEGVEDCESFLQKFDYLEEELAEGRKWVVELTDVTHPETRNTVDAISLKPVKVDRFLEKFVWSRADKWVLSTATMPFRDNPEEWFDRIGLPGETKVISVDMPFPKENRPIHTSSMIGEFSGSGMYDNMSDIVTSITEIVRNHEGEKGLVHTASYKRAQDLADQLPAGMAMVHDREKDPKEQIDEWQASTKPLLLSPSMMEGVDLHDDLCRYQILLKVPYPYLGDSRVSYLTQEMGDWNWYMTETALSLWQSVGRAVRSKEDHADYYVLDEKFMDVVKRTSPPGWVTEALVN